MRISYTLIFAMLLGAASTFAALPGIPGTNEVVRYQTEQNYPAFQLKTLPRERGDALLSALDGGRQIQEWHPANGVGIGAVFQAGTNVICRLPVTVHDWLNLHLTNGSVYRLGIGDGFVELPEGRYEVKDAARNRIAGVMSQLNEDLRHEILSAPKPLVYIVGTVDDGGTLSGISQLFYKDAAKWRKIYEANRQAIKNPNSITIGMRLTIPKLH
jgi:LysM domain